MGSSSGAALGGSPLHSDRRRSLPSPSRFGVPRMWLLGGSITSSKVWVNMAAEKNATQRIVSVPVLARSCPTLVGSTKTLPGPTGKVPSSRRSSPVPEMTYWVSSV